MKCIISSSYLKLFGRSIHCLSKIGDELFLEALKDGLALRSVNSSRSAYVCFHFSKVFFYEYDQGCEFIDSSNPTEMLKCKLSMKSCINIFKSLTTIEKNVDQCKIEFHPNECRLIFTLFCKYGITKTYNLTYQESESLQAIFSKELCPNIIVAQSKVLQDTVSNFPNNCEEITLTVCPQSVKIKNYIESEPDFSKIVNTEMTLAPEEFDNFQIGIDTEVTFCLKELRAILAFTEYVNQPLSLHFEHPGKPIIFALDNDEAFDAHFVMATLSENISSTQQSNGSTTESNAITTKNISGADSSKSCILKKQILNKKDKLNTFQKTSANDSVNLKLNNCVVPEADPFFSESCPYIEFMEIPPVKEISTLPSCDPLILQISKTSNLSVNKGLEEVFHGPVKKKSKFFDDVDDSPKKDNINEIVLLCADTDDESD